MNDEIQKKGNIFYAANEFRRSLEIYFGHGSYQCCFVYLWNRKLFIRNLSNLIVKQSKHS